MKNVKNLLMLMALVLVVTVVSCDEQLAEDITPQEQAENGSANSRLRMMNSDTLDTQNMDKWSQVTASALPQSAQDYLNSKYEGIGLAEGWQTDTGAYVVLLDNDMVVVFTSGGEVVLEFDLEALLGDHDEDDEEWDEIPLDSLPQSIIDYVADNYPNSAIEEAAACPENNHIIVFLDSDEALEFDADGNFIKEWDDADWEDDDWEEEWEEMAVDSLAQAIKDYVAANYPNATIEEAGKFTDQEEIIVFLSTGEILAFDKDGNFLEELDEDEWDDDDWDDEEWEEVAADSLPQPIKDYLAANHAGVAVDEAAFNKEDEEYYVLLDNHLLLVFDKEGNFVKEYNEDDWEEDCTEMNPEDLPQTIKDYLAANYAARTIEEAYYSEEDEEYYVVLDNDLVVVFDKDGNFVEEFEDD